MTPTFPSETVDEILGHVGPYADVLNVALCSKAFHSVAIPHHLHYRDIRSKLHHEALWLWLSRPDDLHAANIWSLSILNDDLRGMSAEGSYSRRERVPIQFSRCESQPCHTLTADDCCEAQIGLISALRRMSSLRQFCWDRSSRPVLETDDDIWATLDRLGTVKVLDILDMDSESPPITQSNTFLRLSGFTSLRLRTHNPGMRLLEQMLLDNCPSLEVLSLEVYTQDHHTTSAERLLRNALWPNLRVLRLRGDVHCRVPELVRFLTAHPTIEELALARMMPGHGWPELRLPPDALPNLRHLESSSAQAAALLNNGSARPLETLRGIEVHDRVRIAHYFDPDGHWGDEDMDIPSPWKAAFIKCIQAQTSLIRLGVATLDGIQEFETLARLAPQLREVDIHFSRCLTSGTEWSRVYALLPSLEVTQTTLFCLPRQNDQVNSHIQGLVEACPRLRVIWTWCRSKKVVVIRSQKSKGVRWIVRQPGESDDLVVRDGETVHGP